MTMGVDATYNQNRDARSPAGFGSLYVFGFLFPASERAGDEQEPRTQTHTHTHITQTSGKGGNAVPQVAYGSAGWLNSSTFGPQAHRPYG